LSWVESQTNGILRERRGKCPKVESHETKTGSKLKTITLSNSKKRKGITEKRKKKVEQSRKKKLKRKKARGKKKTEKGK